MNVRPVVLVVAIVGCTIAGWVIGRHTLIKVDTENGSDKGGQNLETSNKNQKLQNKNSALKDRFSDTMKKGDDIWIDAPSSKDQQINNIKDVQTTKNKSIPTNLSSQPLLSKLLTTSRSLPQTAIQNIQQSIRKVIPTNTKSLKVYMYDMHNWNLDNNVCKTNEILLKATLKNSVGDTPIYIHKPEDDKWISKDLYENGHWEGGYINLIYRLLREDKELQFVDLGANIGVFALSVAKFGRKVIAVEPLSINLQRLCKSVEEGISADGEQFSDKIIIIHNALSNVREHVQLGKDRQNVGGTYVLKGTNQQKVHGSVIGGKFKEDVIATKLDDLLQLPNFDFKKVILKIDVESYESKVFNGGKKFFDTVDVRAVLMEWRWHEGAKDIQTLLDFFTRRKYKPYDPKQIPPSALDISQAQGWPGDVLWQK